MPPFSRTTLGCGLRVGSAGLQLVQAGERFYERHGFVEMHRTDGRDNEEGAPDILCLGLGPPNRWALITPLMPWTTSAATASTGARVAALLLRGRQQKRDLGAGAAGAGDKGEARGDTAWRAHRR